MDTFEDRLRSLAARGFGISVSVNIAQYGKQKGNVVFGVRLKRGEFSSGIEASGEGMTLDEAAGAALRAGEAFITDPAQPAAIRGAIGDMAANLLPAE